MAKIFALEIKHLCLFFFSRSAIDLILHHFSTSRLTPLSEISMLYTCLAC